MRTTIKPLLLAAAVSVCLASSAEAAKPNILYFLVDDLGWGSIGRNGQDARRAAGLPAVQTPNIDSLADAGVNFQRGYGATVCSPSRSSLMTGLHQGHNYADRNDPDNSRKAIRTDDVTIADALKAAGYVNGCWGKWGYGGSSDHNSPAIVNLQTLPNSHGFDDVLAELHHVRAHTFWQPTLWHALPGDANLVLIPNSMSNYTNYADYPEYPAYQNDPAYPSTAYCDDFYAFRALDFVRTQAQQYNADGTPFFAYFNPQIPHTPLGNITSLPNWNAAYTNDPDFVGVDSASRNIAAMITRIDAHFGNLLDALEDPNNDGNTNDSVAANTLVVFSSDNGGQGSHDMDLNGGLKGAKGSIHDGGIRVPMVLRWPAMIHSNSVLRAGTNTQRVVDGTDWLPTFCELAGVDTPLGVDGVSLAAYLTGTEEKRTRDFIIHEVGTSRSIIRDNMKSRGNTTMYLYDLALDHAEATNIASAHPALVAELTELVDGERTHEPAWFAVTYHDWTGADGADASSSNNWSAYIYSNAVNQTEYERDDGAPQLSWIAEMLNAGGSDNTAAAITNLDFLALEIAGASSNAMQILNVSNCTVNGRNEIRLKPHGKVLLNHGTLESLRWVELRTNAVIEGSGTIDATLLHEGRLAVTGADAIALPSGGPTTHSLLGNGGFESGIGTKFSQTDEWYNSGSGTDQELNVRNTNNPRSGSYRGVVGKGGQTSPTVNTGYTISTNDTYGFSFYHAGAGNWDLSNDTITATLFYSNVTEQVVGSVTATPTQDYADGYDFTNKSFTATAAADGHTLYLRLESTDAGGSEYGAIDDVVLEAVSPATASNIPARRVCSIRGDYHAEPTAVLDVTLAGTATQAVDYAHVAIDGAAALDGALAVTVDPGFTPAGGDSFQILTADSISGTFDNADDEVTSSDGTRFSIGYSSTGVTVTVSADGATLSVTNAIPPDALVSNLDSNASSGYSAVEDGNTKGQSFILAEGIAIDGVMFQIRSVATYGDITVSLYAADGSGLPTGGALHSDTAALPNPLAKGDFIKFLFSSSVDVSAGGYAFAVSTTTADFRLEVDLDDGYAGGDLIKNQGSWQVESGKDLAFAILGSEGAGPPERPAASTGPNVVFVLVDDWGWTDHDVPELALGHESDFFQTPNFSRLASEGVMFSSAYAQPNCAPTRAALLSGQYSPRHGNGVYNVASLNRQGGKTVYTTPADQGDEHAAGDEQAVMISEAFYNSGYVTAHFGKYHAGATDPSDSTFVLNQGFDYNYGGNNNGAPGNYLASGQQFHSKVGPELDAFAADYTIDYITNNLVPYNNGNDPTVLTNSPRKHLTDAMADAFVSFMNDHSSGSMSNYPVYVQLHFYAVHGPITARPDLKTKYDELH